MSLQFILGASGSGKSTKMCQMVCDAAQRDNKERFIVLSPDQFTMETQKLFVQKSKGNGILNIDVLSFHRLAYRVFEEMPAFQKTILEDTGKTMLVAKVLSEQGKNLLYFKKGIKSPGFLDEMKSFLCELMMYRIAEEDMDNMIHVAQTDSLTELKLKDLKRIYHEFKEKMGEDYMTAEEILPQLSSVVSKIDMVRGTTVCIDGFTGFTPCQYELLEEMLKVAKKVVITLTLDKNTKRQDMFHLSYDTIRDLTNICRENGIPVEEPILVGQGKDLCSYRFLDKEGGLPFLSRYIFAPTTKQYDKKPKDLSLYLAKNPKTEAEYVARSIWQLVAKENYRYEEIAVITGDLSRYDEYFEQAFTRLGIRYFIDQKKNIAANAFSEFIVSFLEMMQKGLDYESTLRFLRCSLSDFTREEVDQVENYILAMGKRGYKQYSQEWRLPSGSKEWDMVLINQIRERVYNLASGARENFTKGKKTVAQYTKSLYEVVKKAGIFEKLNAKELEFDERDEKLLAKEYHSVYRIMMELFEQMIDLMGDEVVTFREYRDLLGAGISEGVVGFIPQAMDQVIVGDMTRSRLGDIKVLFFIGINDGVVPGGIISPGVLSKRERMMLEENSFKLAPGARETSLTEQFYMYLTLTKPSVKLYLSYSKLEVTGGVVRPSYLIHKIKSLFPFLEVVDEDIAQITAYDRIGFDRGRSALLEGLSAKKFHKEPGWWWELYRYFMEEEGEVMKDIYLPLVFGNKENPLLTKYAADLLYGGNLRGSVSRLEQYARCPFSHFISYGLDLKERQVYSVSSMDFGNVFHKSLETFSAYIQNNHLSWRELDEKQLETLSGQCVEEAVAGYSDAMFMQSERIHFISNRMKRMMKRTVETIALQMRRGRYEQKGYEIVFANLNHIDKTVVELEEGRRMELKGKIDRVDTYETEDSVYVRVVDYKTGSRELKLETIANGLQMQLVVYMEAAMALERDANKQAKKIVPGGMFYYQIQDPMLDHYMEEGEDEGEIMADALKMKGCVNESTEAVLAMDKTLGTKIIDSGLTSHVFNYKTLKKGGTASGTMAYSGNFMEHIIHHTREKMRTYGNEIVKGHKEIAPYRMKNETGCDYCSLRSICGFDPAMEGNKYRDLDDKAAVKELMNMDHDREGEA